MFIRKSISLMITVGVLFGLNACGEGGIKDKNSTTMTDVENGINNLTDANTSSTDIDIPDINTSTGAGDTGDINTSSLIPEIGTGHYVDAAVKGVTYDCGNQDGVTDDNGTFTFEEGQKCIFTLSGIVLRELNASQLEDKMIVVEKNIDNARLLQTLDNDGDADNGIEITQNVLNAITQSGQSIVPVGDDELGSFFQNIEGAEGYSGAMVTIADAQAHLSQTIKDLGLEDTLNQIPTEEEVENSADSVFNGL
ncbi:MAG TPA: hypothetical protein ENK88_01390 [Campylobacterales bacterium]|nr:hypothetical protein [Campylobacterales bacterium]